MLDSVMWGPSYTGMCREAPCTWDVLREQVGSGVKIPRVLVLYGSVVHTHLCVYANAIRAVLNFGGCEGVLLRVHKHLSSVPAHWKSCKSILPRYPPKLNGTHTGLTSSAETMHTHKSSPTTCRSTTDHAKTPGSWDRQCPTRERRQTQPPCCPDERQTKVQASRNPPQPGHPNAVPCVLSLSHEPVQI